MELRPTCVIYTQIDFDSRPSFRSTADTPSTPLLESQRNYILKITPRDTSILLTVSSPTWLT